MFDWFCKLNFNFVFDILGLVKRYSTWGCCTFLYLTVKIFILLISIIYFITFIQKLFFPLKKNQSLFMGKSKIVGHILAGIFGIITPFCSCSAIPLFLGFFTS